MVECCRILSRTASVRSQKLGGNREQEVAAENVGALPDTGILNKNSRLANQWDAGKDKPHTVQSTFTKDHNYSPAFASTQLEIC